MMQDILLDVFPFVFYGAFIAAAVVCALKTHIHTQAVLTLVSCGIFILGYMGVQDSHGESGLGVALMLLFLVMFPCGIFTSVMWLTTSFKMSYDYFKSRKG